MSSSTWALRTVLTFILTCRIAEAQTCSTANVSLPTDTETKTGGDVTVAHGYTMEIKCKDPSLKPVPSMLLCVVVGSQAIWKTDDGQAIQPPVCKKKCGNAVPTAPVITNIDPARDQEFKDKAVGETAATPCNTTYKSFGKFVCTDGTPAATWKPMTGADAPKCAEMCPSTPPTTFSTIGNVDSAKVDDFKDKAEGETAMFSCNSGFAPTVKYECKMPAAGQSVEWQATNPKCEAGCDSVTIANLKGGPLPATLPGIQVTIVCKDGYTRSGSQGALACNAGTPPQWSFSPMTIKCEASQCLAADLPAGTEPIPGETVPAVSGNMLQIRCTAPDQKAMPSTLMCDKPVGGVPVWKTDTGQAIQAPVCKAKCVGPLPSIPHLDGSRATFQDKAVGDTVTPPCDMGFQEEGMFECKNVSGTATWEAQPAPDAPECVNTTQVQCQGSVPSIDHIDTARTTIPNKVVGDIVDPPCEAGFVPAGKFECMPAGTWGPFAFDGPKCQGCTPTPGQSGLPADIIPDVSPAPSSDSKIGESLSVRCTVTTKAATEDNVTCDQPPGGQRGAPPVWQTSMNKSVACEDGCQVTAGQQFTDQNKLPEGTEPDQRKNPVPPSMTITIKCTDPAQSAAIMQLKCDGTPPIWQDPTGKPIQFPVCTGGPPPATSPATSAATPPAPSMATPPATSVATSVATSPATPPGVTTTTSAPNCPDLQQPSNGDVEFNDTHAEYSCNAKFKLDGPQLRSCLPDGTWSAEEPKCVKDSFCSHPALPAVVLIGVAFGVLHHR